MLKIKTESEEGLSGEECHGKWGRRDLKVTILRKKYLNLDKWKSITRQWLWEVAVVDHYLINTDCPEAAGRRKGERKKTVGICTMK